MTGADPQVADAVTQAIEALLDSTSSRPVVIGLCGAQGCGKTTLARALLEQCRAADICVAILSIDDLYLTRSERLKLAREVHPLLATRGPPGTHDVGLGLEVLAALDRGEAAKLPRFDKARDDRAPPGDWEISPARCEVLLFEGWCVGAKPQGDEALRDPVNALEAAEDAQGVWRSYVNRELAGDYQRLFSAIDCLVLLAAPGFEVVFEWRMQQERELRLQSGSGAAQVMDEAAIARFIQLYERLTRHILAEMPARADILVRLDASRTPVELQSRWRENSRASR